jgi:hypothetical protein
MPAAVIDYSEGIITVKLAGRLAESEPLTTQQEVAGLIQGKGKVGVVVIATEAFDGWERGGAWDSFVLQEQNDPNIHRMAIVGDPRWEDLALMFVAKGLRPFPVEYFSLEQGTQARMWVGGELEHSQ